MKTITETLVDKSNWQTGPWQQEPDKKQWLDEETGLPCLMRRGPSGALCGYVGIAKDHPYYGKEGYEIDVEVHGGVDLAVDESDDLDRVSVADHFVSRFISVR